MSEVPRVGRFLMSEVLQTACIFTGPDVITFRAREALLRVAAGPGSQACISHSMHICVRAARPSGRARCGAGAGCSAIKHQSLSLDVEQCLDASTR